MDEANTEAEVVNCDKGATLKFCDALEQLLGAWVVFKVNFVVCVNEYVFVDLRNAHGDSQQHVEKVVSHD